MSDDINPGDDLAEAVTPTDEFQPEIDAPSGVGAIFGPFLNAILAPAQTWEAIDARPALAGWIALWVAVFSTAIAVYNMPITQQIMVQTTVAQMRAQGSEVSAEQAAQMADNMRTFGTVITYGNSVFILLGMALMALLIWVMSMMMGGKGASFGRAFGVAAGAAVIHPMVYSIYASIILNMNPPEIRRASDASTIAPTLGLDLILAGPDTPAWLEVLFQRIDVFNLWWAFLIVGGCMAVLKVKKGQAITIAFIIWALFTGVAMLGALAQGLGGS